MCVDGDGGEITRILRQVADRSPGAVDELLALVLDDLRAQARARLSQLPPWRTLSPTALVNEAFVRLFGREGTPSWNDRKHFFLAASRAMHDIIVERARAATRLKRGGGRQRISLNDAEPTTHDEATQFLDLSDALSRLEAERPRCADIVRLRFFAGLSEAEIATTLEVSPATVRREWRVGKGWLLMRLEGEAGPAHE
jgi:RNA polymerase sigma factor (TIGR02999 family)